jgi:hypothetical protein
MGKRVGVDNAHWEPLLRSASAYWDRNVGTPPDDAEIGIMSPLYPVCPPWRERSIDAHWRVHQSGYRPAKETD